MVICICLDVGEVVLSDRPEDDGGLHQRVCGLSSAVRAARAAAVVCHLHDVALELVLIHLVADVEGMTRCVARDDGGRLLARCIRSDRTEDDRGGVEGVCYCGKIGFDGVKELECGVAEPPYLTDVGNDVVNADLARNVNGIVIVLVTARCKARCGLLCGLKCLLGPEVAHNSLEIELGELLVFVHQSAEMVGVRVRDDPSGNGDVLVGLGIVLRLLAQSLDYVCGVDAGVAVVAAVNDDEAAVRETVDDAHTVLLIAAVIDAFNAYHGDLRCGNGGGVALLCGKGVLRKGLDDDADLVHIVIVACVYRIFVGVKGGKEAADDLVGGIGLITRALKLGEISLIFLGSGVLNDNAKTVVAHIGDRREGAALVNGQSRGHRLALILDVKLIRSESERLCAVRFLGQRFMNECKQLIYSLGVTRVGKGENDDLVSDSLDGIFAVGQTLCNLCGLGIGCRADKYLECGGIVCRAVLDPVIAELGGNLCDVIDRFSELYCGLYDL